MSTPTTPDEQATLNVAQDTSSSSSSSPLSDDSIGESPLQSMPDDFRLALEEFRNKWRNELSAQSSPSRQQSAAIAETAIVAADAEKLALAEQLFNNGAELERRGKVYDALPFYRKAVQIVPDIEFRMYEEQKLKMSNQQAKEQQQQQRNYISQHEAETANSVVEQQEEFVADLYEKFQLDLAHNNAGRLLLSSRDASVISTEMHMSELPPEILLYILRWVISAQLDMCSLEQCAAVCKGMYICARDEELWRLACVRIWGHNVGTPAQPMRNNTSDDIIMPVYNSWRHMFIERERVLFNGCYISKTTYLRMGENSFQDQFYRPVQLVEYYRYLRFLPDGTVLMMTNAEEPAVGVTKLRNLQQLRADVLRGQYTLYGNTISIVLTKQQSLISNLLYAKQRRGANHAQDMNSTKFNIEFCIVSTPKRKFGQLVWQHYDIVQTRNRVETSTEFDLTPSKYPALWFSPVRSYHLVSDAPLG